MFLNHQIQNSLKNPGLRVLPLFEDSKVGLGVVDDITVSDTLFGVNLNLKSVFDQKKKEEKKKGTTAQTLKSINKPF